MHRTSRKQRRAFARRSNRFTLLECDVAAKGEDLVAAVESVGASPELILHFASPASPIDYFESPVATMAANSLGTLHCLQAAQRWECSR